MDALEPAVKIDCVLKRLVMLRVILFHHCLGRLLHRLVDDIVYTTEMIRNFHNAINLPLVWWPGVGRNVPCLACQEYPLEFSRAAPAADAPLWKLELFSK